MCVPRSPSETPPRAVQTLSRRARRKRHDPAPKGPGVQVVPGAWPEDRCWLYFQPDDESWRGRRGLNPGSRFPSAGEPRDCASSDRLVSGGLGSRCGARGQGIGQMITTSPSLLLGAESQAIETAWEEQSRLWIKWVFMGSVEGLLAS